MALSAILIIYYRSSIERKYKILLLLIIIALIGLNNYNATVTESVRDHYDTVEKGGMRKINNSSDSIVNHLEDFMSDDNDLEERIKAWNSSLHNSRNISDGTQLISSKPDLNVNQNDFVIILDTSGRKLLHLNEEFLLKEEFSISSDKKEKLQAIKSIFYTIDDADIETQNDIDENLIKNLLEDYRIIALTSHAEEVEERLN
ncbi:hypothetical protein [Natranaerofaba carboxydovora]|uniref:hypothetical protein n=1 Tax=Natranaerofaba carboxydovora TaxID=2742683 RepID=UPI001F143E92|nr:hypothetical protein [Natranaerofaba carboxydovora]UMZ74406.1 hypothetical protein ACONDI_01995 [Natranaerofaba carboxydovora]